MTEQNKVDGAIFEACLEGVNPDVRERVRKQMDNKVRSGDNPQPMVIQESTAWEPDSLIRDHLATMEALTNNTKIQ